MTLSITVISQVTTILGSAIPASSSHPFSSDKFLALKAWSNWDKPIYNFSASFIFICESWDSNNIQVTWYQKWLIWHQHSSQSPCMLLYLQEEIKLDSQKIILSFPKWVWEKTFCSDQMMWYKQFCNKIIISSENIWVI